MPPDLPPALQDSIDEHASLSDQNVAILYEIVQNAESQPNVEIQPFRAIFTAYDKVLPEWGINPAHDQVYLRFLFRFGDKRRQEETLFQSFERLLEELGIQIEFKNEGDPAPDEAEDAKEQADLEIWGSPRKRRARRASFSTIYDAEDEITRAFRTSTQFRAVSQGQRFLDRRSEEPRSSSRATTRPTERVTNVSNPERVSATPEGGRLTARADRNDFMHFEQREFPTLGTGDQHHQQRPTWSQPQGPSDIVRPSDDHQTLSSTGSAEERVDKIPSLLQNILSAQIPTQARMYQPTRTQLSRDADTFQYYRIRSVARDVVDRWCDAALKAQSHREHLRRLAVAHDTEILLRQAFEHWRVKLHARKQAAETERFFNRLEKRAVKARDLYLLTKAFTHWVQCTHDEIYQRSMARRQVLAIKYFHAWRDVTVENQNKMQYRLMTTHFSAWKQHYVDNLTNFYKADLSYKQSLIKHGYWQWFWNFCERRAPEWHARKLKQKFVLQWWDHSKIRSRQLATVVFDRRAHTKGHVFFQWSLKAQARRSTEARGTAFREQSLARHALQTWIRKIRFAPMRQQTSNMVDWRIASATFAVFVNRFRFEKQAEKLDRLRNLRIHWTQWNDHLRRLTLHRRMDDRFILEALYKWVVAERYLLLRRLSKERLISRYFSILKNQVAARQRQHGQLLGRFQNRSSRLIMSDALTSWVDLRNGQRRAEQIAYEFRAPKVAHETLELWNGCLKDQGQMNTWADDARFYFLAKRVIKCWRRKAIESKRQKRRDAYAIIRRKTKVRLASQIVQHWRDQASRLTALHQQSCEVNQQRLLQVGTGFFDVWKNGLDIMSGREYGATQHYHQQLLKRFIHLWNDQANHQWEMEDTAMANTELHVQRTALVCLRKLRLRIIELKSQRGKAEGLKINYEKRHFLNLIRLWRDRTEVHQNKPSSPTIMRSRLRKHKKWGDEHDLGATKRAEEWTELDTQDWIPGTEAQASSTPLPGYSSTPSKRAARAKSMVHSTTPLGTPFQSRLRAQLNTTPRTFRLGRSTNIAGGEFGSILEESPVVPSISRVEGD